MDANAVLRTELARRQVQDIGQLEASEVVDLVLRYSIWLPVDTYQRAPWLAPFAVRRIRIRPDPLLGDTKRDLWGAPDEAGYFTDDNSLIKGVARRGSVTPITSPYGTAKITKGLVCCHIWGGTTSNPLLFSFVPNLAWLPRELAKFTDVYAGREPHAAHATLQGMALDRYRRVRPLVAESRVEQAWTALGRLPEAISFPAAEFDVGDDVVNLATARIQRLTSFLGAVLGGEPPPPRFSKRYHAGYGPRIDIGVPAVNLQVPTAVLSERLSELAACLVPDVALETARQFAEFAANIPIKER